MRGKDILIFLRDNYHGLDCLRYRRRFEFKADNKVLTAHWLMDNFDCSYGVAYRLVDSANSFSDDFIFHRYGID